MSSKSTHLAILSSVRRFNCFPFLDQLHDSPICRPSSPTAPLCWEDAGLLSSGFVTLAHPGFFKPIRYLIRGLIDFLRNSLISARLGGLFCWIEATNDIRLLVRIRPFDSPAFRKFARPQIPGLTDMDNTKRSHVRMLVPVPPPFNHGQISNCTSDQERALVQFDLGLWRSSHEPNFESGALHVL
jgi:hypothetical protein